MIVFDMQVYTGKVAGTVEHGLAYRVVNDLCEPHLPSGNNHVVYMDNFFTSLPLSLSPRLHRHILCRYNSIYSPRISTSAERAWPYQEIATWGVSYRCCRLPHHFCVEGHKGGVLHLERPSFPGQLHRQEKEET